MEDRITEYVDYHINGDADCNTIVLRSYADTMKLSLQDRFDLAYFFSLTYCIPSSILMLKEKNRILEDINLWIEGNKDIIIFQSDRRYMRIGDNLKKCLEYYKSNLMGVEQFLGTIMINNTISTEKALKRVEKWYYFGRFASYLFLETFYSLIDYKKDNTYLDWKNGDTATSGLLNVYGLDNIADYFDRTNKLPKNITISAMNSMLDKIIKKIKLKNGDSNITNIETSLCAYRKFYKGTRYNGFYLDRQLEEINMTNKLSSKYKEINNQLLEIRKNKFNPKYLGELNNWIGVRKDCKKLYKEKGIMM